MPLEWRRLVGCGATYLRAGELRVLRSSALDATHHLSGTEPRSARAARQDHQEHAVPPVAIDPALQPLLEASWPALRACCPGCPPT